MYLTLTPVLDMLSIHRRETFDTRCLPSELWIKIFVYVGIEFILRLRATNRHMLELIDRRSTQNELVRTWFPWPSEIALPPLYDLFCKYKNTATIFTDEHPQELRDEIELYRHSVKLFPVYEYIHVASIWNRRFDVYPTIDAMTWARNLVLSCIQPDSRCLPLNIFKFAAITDNAMLMELLYDQLESFTMGTHVLFNIIGVYGSKKVFLVLIRMLNGDNLSLFSSEILNRAVYFGRLELIKLIFENVNDARIFNRFDPVCALIKYEHPECVNTTIEKMIQFRLVNRDMIDWAIRRQRLELLKHMLPTIDIDDGYNIINMVSTSINESDNVLLTLELLEYARHQFTRVIKQTRDTKELSILDACTYMLWRYDYSILGEAIANGRINHVRMLLDVGVDGRWGINYGDMVKCTRYVMIPSRITELLNNGENDITPYQVALRIGDQTMLKMLESSGNAYVVTPDREFVKGKVKKGPLAQHIRLVKTIVRKRHERPKNQAHIYDHAYMKPDVYCNVCVPHKNIISLTGAMHNMIYSIFTRQSATPSELHSHSRIRHMWNLRVP